MPDIQGAISGRYGARVGDWGASGCFEVFEWTPIEVLGGSDTYQDTSSTIAFKASLYNQLYGKSNTVQPLSLSCQYLIRY